MSFKFKLQALLQIKKINLEKEKVFLSKEFFKLNQIKKLLKENNLKIEEQKIIILNSLQSYESNKISSEYVFLSVLKEKRKKIMPELKEQEEIVKLAQSNMKKILKEHDGFEELKAKKKKEYQDVINKKEVRKVEDLNMINFIRKGK